MTLLHTTTAEIATASPYFCIDHRDQQASRHILSPDIATAEAATHMASQSSAHGSAC